MSELRDALVELKKDIGPDIGMFMAQWAAQQAMGIEQEALSTLVVRRVREKLDAALAARPVEAKAEPGDFHKAISGLLRERFGAGNDGKEDYREETNGIAALFLLTRPAPAEDGLRETLEAAIDTIRHDHEYCDNNCDALSVVLPQLRHHLAALAGSGEKGPVEAVKGGEA
jgi:hypothetical protein